MSLESSVHIICARHRCRKQIWSVVAMLCRKTLRENIFISLAALCAAANFSKCATLGCKIKSFQGYMYIVSSLISSPSNRPLNYSIYVENSKISSWLCNFVPCSGNKAIRRNLAHGILIARVPLQKWVLSERLLNHYTTNSSLIHVPFWFYGLWYL